MAKKILYFVFILFGLAILGIGLYDYCDSKEPAEEPKEEDPIVDVEPGGDETAEDEVALLTFCLYDDATGQEVASFNFEEGMTWNEFFYSDYNISFAMKDTGEILYEGNYVYRDDFCTINVELNDPITANWTYYICS